MDHDSEDEHFIKPKESYYHYSELPTSKRELIKLDTFFGIRRPPEKVLTSRNCYQYIKDQDLSKLSAMTSVPDFYFKSLLLYIIHISRSMAHAHKHDVAHGNYDLSKVIVHKLPKFCGKINFDHNFNETNFYVTNFEPFQVFKHIKEFTEDESGFADVLNITGMKPDVSSIIQMVKVMDLHAFGNSIIEYMVAKSTESKKEKKKINILNLVNP